MDGNKDEALRCVRNAEEAIGSGKKELALKFVKIAQRLNRNLEVDELLAACEKLDSGFSGSSVGQKSVEENVEPDGVRAFEGSNEGRSYTEEHVNLIRQINRTRDYYSILGVEKSCSVEEIRKAYRKLSLKVHPDKNKAPGSEEVFKKVCQAFKCLSDNDSRKKYDQTGVLEDYEYNQQHNVRRRRRRTANDLFNDDFDPDEIFRSFFGQPNVFRTNRVYRTRETTSNHQREENNGGGPNLIVLLQILPFLLIVLLAYLPFSEPDYSLHKNVSYQIPRTTAKYGVEFYTKSSAFDQNYPPGSPARANVEENVINDYKNLLWRYCRVELQRRHWSKNLPTPHCDKLQNLGLA